MRKFRASKHLSGLKPIEEVVKRGYKNPPVTLREMKFFTDDELRDHTGIFTFDIEVFPNYFLALFTNFNGCYLNSQ